MKQKGDDAPMPWSRAARLVLARGTPTAAAARERKTTADGKGSGDEATPSLLDGSSRAEVRPLRTSMPPWTSSDEEGDDDSSSDDDDGEGARRRQCRRQRRQCDDGAWPFALFPSPRDNCSPHYLVLEVSLGSALVTPSDVELDVRRRYVRVFASGSLLCARLPASVVPSRATAKRSLASGKLVVEMREWKKRDGGGAEETTAMKTTKAFAFAARVVVAASDDGDESDGENDILSPPPL